MSIHTNLLQDHTHAYAERHADIIAHKRRARRALWSRPHNDQPKPRLRREVSDLGQHARTARNLGIAPRAGQTRIPPYVRHRCPGRGLIDQVAVENDAFYIGTFFKIL